MPRTVLHEWYHFGGATWPRDTTAIGLWGQVVTHSDVTEKRFPTLKREHYMYYYYYFVSRGCAVRDAQWRYNSDIVMAVIISNLPMGCQSIGYVYFCARWPRTSSLTTTVVSAHPLMTISTSSLWCREPGNCERRQTRRLANINTPTNTTT